MSTLGNKKIELFDMGAGPSAEPTAEDNVQVASGESSMLSFLWLLIIELSKHIKRLYVWSLNLKLLDALNMVNYLFLLFV